MPGPVAALSFAAALYVAGFAPATEPGMSALAGVLPSPGIVLVQGSCSSAPTNCKSGLPVTQICKRTTPGQTAGILWITCSAEGYPTLWKPTPIACTCSS